jgi:hypothetical protein
MPSMTENNSSQDSAIPIEDNDWSQVFYHEAGCDARQLWLEVDGTAGEPLFVQLGAPVFSTLEDHTWQFALVGPGLPETPTPFPLSVGLGAELRTGAEAGDAEFFYEPFTQTNSWILHEETFVLPETGTYYVVAWELSGFPSRFWVSTGTREEFDFSAIAELLPLLNLVKTFHNDIPLQTDIPCPENVFEDEEVESPDDESPFRQPSADSESASAEEGLERPDDSSLDPNSEFGGVDAGTLSDVDDYESGAYEPQQNAAAGCSALMGPKGAKPWTIGIILCFAGLIAIRREVQSSRSV